jgi:hypothetical protein
LEHIAGGNLRNLLGAPLTGISERQKVIDDVTGETARPLS